MKREDIKELVLLIIGSVDYDLVKDFDPETAEEPEYAENNLTRIVKDVENFLSNLEKKDK